MTCQNLANCQWVGLHNGLGLCEGQGIELQMFKISTNDR